MRRTESRGNWFYEVNTDRGITADQDLEGSLELSVNP